MPTKDQLPVLQMLQNNSDDGTWLPGLKKGGNSMKRVITILLVAVLILTVGTAFANPISIKGLKEDRLYDLYSQVQSQILLEQLRKKPNYVPVKDYEDFARNPDKYTDKSIYFEGTVVQVVEGDQNTYRIALDKKHDQIFLVTYTLPEDGERFLEDDKVAVYAKFKDLYTYSSTVNMAVTVPYCEAVLIVHPVTNNYVLGATMEELETARTEIREQLTKLTAKDKEGYTKFTKKNYGFYAKNPGLHKDEPITFTGKALQVIDGSVVTTVRVAVDSDSDKVIYLSLPNDLTTIRILDDDTVIVKGAFTGLYTYSSTRGGEITIPACTDESVSVKGYKAPGKAQKDKNGNYKVTKKTFGDYSRRPKEHTDEPITFSAKIVQVIEGSTVSEYRMAVDNDLDCIFYVTLPNDSRTMRVLDDDVVTVTGTFGGLLTYESTIGAPVTVPKCAATSVVIPGKKATIASKDASGRYVVTKDNYELFARDEDTYKSETLSFTAEVYQVVDDESMTIYRLAVDKSSDAMILGIIMNDDLDIRMLEDDIVTVEATSTGLYSYSSAFGGTITIPSCLITSYTVKDYTKVELGQPDGDGNYRITKQNYEEIARNPDPYRLKGMTFKGKIIQVSESDNGDNIYRIAVDSDSNCMMLVQYTFPSGASHLLEKDIVTVKGMYYGIFTYETTMNSTVSVPALLATEIKR